MKALTLLWSQLWFQKLYLSVNHTTRVGLLTVSVPVKLKKRIRIYRYTEGGLVFGSQPNPSTAGKELTILFVIIQSMGSRYHDH